MFGSTWKKLRRPATTFLQSFAMLLAGAFFFSRCGALNKTGASNKVYEPPRLGAEYRFDEEYKQKKKKDKNTSNLFDRKTRKEMEEMGMMRSGSSAPKAAKSAAAPVSGLSKSPASGSTADSSVAKPRKDSAVFKVLPQ